MRIERKSSIAITIACVVVLLGALPETSNQAWNLFAQTRGRAKVQKKRSAAAESSGAARAIPAETRAALDRVSAASLRGHLSFIASDLLEGRATPSPGLDTAALYIAAQFRRAGLEPAGDDGYFQTANWFVALPDVIAFQLAVNDGQETISVSPAQVSFTTEAALNVTQAAIVKVDFGDKPSIEALAPAQIEGKVVLTEIPDFRREGPSRWADVYRAQNEFTAKMTALNAALILSVDRHSSRGSEAGQGRLIDPERRIGAAQRTGVTVVTVHDPRMVRLHDQLKPGASACTVNLRIPAATEKPVKLRNVIGVLRGSDPVLRDTYVLLTAHYDHVGVQPGKSGDDIFNGANDNGSGTVSVIELAAALSAMREPPKRSLVFMTYFGEERGLFGSRYYARHPVFAIEKTVANINLEQVGRTDSTEGPQINNASLTGFDYSDIGSTLKAAGDQTGITVYKHARNSDSFFDRSDNQALADVGVPAHTLCTAFQYPDYHGAGDHWEKIDYENMARVDRMIGMALLMIANNPEPPKWNAANPKTARYVEAWKRRHSGTAGTQ
jgi:hypothetical protein